MKFDISGSIDEQLGFYPTLEHMRFAYEQLLSSVGHVTADGKQKVLSLAEFNMIQDVPESISVYVELIHLELSMEIAEGSMLEDEMYDAFHHYLLLINASHYMPYDEFALDAEGETYADSMGDAYSPALSLTAETLEGLLTVIEPGTNNRALAYLRDNVRYELEALKLKGDLSATAKVQFYADQVTPLLPLLHGGSMLERVLTFFVSEMYDLSATRI
ncbi:hypothetical protein AB4254_10930 [Vibrio breoganii]